MDARLTLCNFLVDETTNEQRASHKLREAPFCGRCVKRVTDEQLDQVQACFTTRGVRRHYTLKRA